MASINRSWWRLLYVICSCWKLTDAFLMSLAASAVAPNLRSISFCFVHFCSASITDRGFEAIVKCCKGLERVCSWRIACCTWHLARHNIQACRVLYVVRAASKRLQHLGVARASIPLITAMACILYGSGRTSILSSYADFANGHMSESSRKRCSVFGRVPIAHRFV